MTPMQLLAAQNAHKAHRGHIYSLHKLMEQKIKERGQNDPEVRNLEVVLQEAMDASDEAGEVIRAALGDVARVPKRSVTSELLDLMPAQARTRVEHGDGTNGGPG